MSYSMNFSALTLTPPYLGSELIREKLLQRRSAESPQPNYLGSPEYRTGSDRMRAVNCVLAQLAIAFITLARLSGSDKRYRTASGSKRVKLG